MTAAERSVSLHVAGGWRKAGFAGLAGNGRFVESSSMFGRVESEGVCFFAGAFVGC